MVRRFRAWSVPIWQPRAEARGLSVREMVTLASLVEKETASADERPVGGRRLREPAADRDGTAVRSDRDLRARSGPGAATGNLTRDDLRFDSPYNTYRYAGLPPGPIASPGRASLEAALAPADVPYLYFVSRNDGSHVFATTLAEHNGNVRRYPGRSSSASSGRASAPSAVALAPGSALRPPQLLSQHLEVAAGRGAHQAHRRLGARATRAPRVGRVEARSRPARRR